MVKRIGKVAYKLALPDESKIHPVFHVSQLERKLGAARAVQHQAPSTSVEQLTEPESILAHRMVKRGNQANVGIFCEATWESYQDLIRRFPNFDRETRLISGGENRYDLRQRGGRTGGEEGSEEKRACL